MFKKSVVLIMGALILSSCASQLHRGVVAMKIDESTAHVGLNKSEVTIGDHVELYGNKCKKNAKKKIRLFIFNSKLEIPSTDNDQTLAKAGWSTQDDVAAGHQLPIHLGLLSGEDNVVGHGVRSMRLSGYQGSRSGARRVQVGEETDVSKQCLNDRRVSLEWSLVFQYPNQDLARLLDLVLAIGQRGERREIGKEVEQVYVFASS